MKKESQGLKRRAIGPWPAWCASVRCTKGNILELAEPWLVILFSRASYWMWMTCKCFLQTLLKWIQDLKTLRKEAVRGRVGNESGGIGWDLYRHSPVHRLPPPPEVFCQRDSFVCRQLWTRPLTRKLKAWRQPAQSKFFFLSRSDSVTAEDSWLLDIQTLLLSLLLKAQVGSKNEDIHNKV